MMMVSYFKNGESITVHCMDKTIDFDNGFATVYDTLEFGDWHVIRITDIECIWYEN